MTSHHKKQVKLKNIVLTILTIFLVLLAVLLAGVRLLGLTPYSVISGSMASSYPVGSLIYVKAVNLDDLEPGDVITFVRDEHLTLVTHRITHIDDERQFFYTKGDENTTEDFAPVSARNILGSPLFYIPLLGYVSYYISHPPGIYILIILSVFIFVYLIYDYFLRKKSPHNN